jgi:hypothetical protein
MRHGLGDEPLTYRYTVATGSRPSVCPAGFEVARPSGFEPETFGSVDRLAERPVAPALACDDPKALLITDFPRLLRPVDARGGPVGQGRHKGGGPSTRRYRPHPEEHARGLAVNR